MGEVRWGNPWGCGAKGGKFRGAFVFVNVFWFVFGGFWGLSWAWRAYWWLVWEEPEGTERGWGFYVFGKVVVLYASLVV